MDISKVSRGKNFPKEINAIIEISQDSVGIKYEFDKDSGAIFVDRFLMAPMHYPANYGFVPHTMGNDGDPVDVLVISKYKLLPGCIIPVRPVGVLKMADEKGEDEKIIAVPTSAVCKSYDNIRDINEVPEYLLEQIKHFFERYKDLEVGKFVRVNGYLGVNEAEKILKDSII